MTIKQFRSAIQKADRKIDKAVASYKALLAKLYVPHDGILVRACKLCDRQDGSLRYMTDTTKVFYRLDSNGDFYVKGGEENKTYARDYWEVYRAENVIVAAVDNRDNILEELEDAGYSVDDLAPKNVE